ncbi:MAG: sugar ABC transporter ATP-binding protein [Thermoflexales bacterium]|nr:sugar ABC transporter ATP-binding protein [Thermoflexales bacterium]
MLVELRHIHKRFGAVHANNDVSLTARPGRVHGLLGENGAGKSTLAKILTGFITRDSGDILLDGKPARISTPADATAAGIGMLHQDPLDVPAMTALDNFMAGMPGRSPVTVLRGAAAEKRFREIAAGLGFKLDPRDRVGDFTVGERQQLEVIRLMALGVRTLILDEPTTGISAAQKDQLFEAVRQMAREGRSIIFVSHKLEDVCALCDEVTVMRRGEVMGGRVLREEGRLLDTPARISSDLVTLMFGRELASPSRETHRQEQPAFTLSGVVLDDRRLRIALPEIAIRRGEIIGLAGLEGSGQRLLLQHCAGLLPATAGRLLGRTDLTHKPHKAYLRAGIMYLPADRLKEGLIGGLTLQEHVALRRSVAGKAGTFVNRASALDGAEKAITALNIRGRPDSRVERLSGGNQQRAQLALMPAQLDLILMEHPTRGLDVESAMWVWKLLRERCASGTSILFASADLDEIMQYSDRVIVFSGGQVAPPVEANALDVDRLGRRIGGQMDA